MTRPRARCLLYAPQNPAPGDIGLAHTIGRLNHCGVFYHDAANRLNIAHLAFHLNLKSDERFDRYGWISPAIEEEERDAISLLCRLLIGKQVSSVPYGISHRSRITPGGDIQPRNPGDGFTCATFVMRLFETAAYVTLLDEETWPPSGPEWRDYVVEQIEKFGDRSGIDVRLHVEAIRTDEEEWARFKPEHVCAACCYDSLPVTYDNVLSLSEGLALCVREHVQALGG